jgi:hypothetical protein
MLRRFERRQLAQLVFEFLQTSEGVLQQLFGNGGPNHQPADQRVDGFGERAINIFVSVNVARSSSIEDLGRYLDALQRWHTA